MKLTLNNNIMLLEAMLILIIASSFLLFLGINLSLILQGILSLTYLYLVFLLKKNTKKDFKYYSVFFIGLVLIILTANISLLLTTDSGLKTTIGFYLIGLLLVFFLLFKFLFGRNYCTAEVLVSDNEFAAIKKEFDLLSFSNKGTYVVKTSKAFKKGEKVKVRLGYKGFKRQPIEIKVKP